MKVKIEAVLEFESPDDYDQFLEYADQQHRNLTTYGHNPLREMVANALGLNKGMSSHLHVSPIFTFETVEKLEVIVE